MTAGPILGPFSRRYATSPVIGTTVPGDTDVPLHHPGADTPGAGPRVPAHACLSALVALAACEGATDSLAPEAAGAPEIAAAPSPGLPALTTNRIAFASNMAGGYIDIWTVSPQAGTPTRLTSFTPAVRDAWTEAYLLCAIILRRAAAQEVESPQHR